MSQGLRTAVFILANFVVLTVIGAGAAVGLSAGRAVYAILLFALCSAPILLLDRLNGRYALLGVFAAVYFVFFGALDVTQFASVALASTPDIPIAGPEFWTAGECGILMGGVLLGLGYLVAANDSSAATLGDAVEWPRASVIIVGVLLWVVGSASLVYFQIFVMNEKTVAAATRGLAGLGPVNTFILLLANMMQPLGILLLSYGYARYKSTAWLVTVVCMVLLQMGIGFVTDMKATAMIAPVLVILAKVFVDNRLPKTWLVCSALSLIIVFPIFQAYRSAVAGERGMTRSEALQNLGQVIEIALAAREKAASGENAERSQSFFERASLKANVEMAFEHTGVDTPYMNGVTLLEVPLAFIPRLIWPDKPGAATGLLFNKAFFHGDSNTYISPSHLGELYWNFGWMGVFVGMPAIGAILGFIGRKTNLAKRATLTRLLVLIVTVKGTCLQFEGAISVAYVTWLRSLGAIGILHLMFARLRLAAANSDFAPTALDRPKLSDEPQPLQSAPLMRPSQLAPLMQLSELAPPVQSAQLAPRGPLAPRFPNLMR